MTTYSIMRGGMVFKHLEKDKFLVSNTGEGKDINNTVVKFVLKDLKEVLSSYGVETKKKKKQELIDDFIKLSMNIPVEPKPVPVKEKKVRKPRTKAVKKVAEPEEFDIPYRPKITREMRLALERAKVKPEPEPEEDFDDFSSKLQQLVYVTPIKKITDALAKLNYRGKIPANKMLLNLSLLQNFNTIPKIKDLIELLNTKEEPKEEPKEEMIDMQFRPKITREMRLALERAKEKPKPVPTELPKLSPELERAADPNRLSQLLPIRSEREDELLEMEDDELKDIINDNEIKFKKGDKKAMITAILKHEKIVKGTVLPEEDYDDLVTQHNILSLNNNKGDRSIYVMYRKLEADKAKVAQMRKKPDRDTSAEMFEDLKIKRLMERISDIEEILLKDITKGKKAEAKAEAKAKTKATSKTTPKYKDIYISGLPDNFIMPYISGLPNAAPKAAPKAEPKAAPKAETKTSKAKSQITEDEYVEQYDTNAANALYLYNPAGAASLEKIVEKEVARDGYIDIDLLLSKGVQIPIKTVKKLVLKYGLLPTLEYTVDLVKSMNGDVNTMYSDGIKESITTSRTLSSLGRLNKEDLKKAGLEGTLGEHFNKMREKLAMKGEANNKMRKGLTGGKIKRKGGSISAKDLKGLHASSYKQDPDKEVNGWVLDESISKPTARVYFNASKNQAIVVHRGTEATVKDWANNLAYLTGTNKLTGRYKDAERVQKRAEEKYPDLLTTGHSQGGIYTKIAKDQSKVINVNPASMGETTSGTTIRAKNDPVSALAGFTGLFKKNDKNITTQSKGSLLDAHSIDILDELGDKELGGSLTKYLKMLNKKGKKGKGKFEDFFKKTLPRALVKQGIPIVGSVAGTALGSIAGPVSGAVGAEVGSKAGEVLSKYVSDKAGYGMKGGYLGQNPLPRSFGGGMTRHLKSLGQ